MANTKVKPATEDVVSEVVTGGIMDGEPFIDPPLVNAVSEKKTPQKITVDETLVTKENVKKELYDSLPDMVRVILNPARKEPFFTGGCLIPADHEDPVPIMVPKDTFIADMEKAEAMNAKAGPMSRGMYPTVFLKMDIADQLRSAEHYKQMKKVVAVHKKLDPEDPRDWDADGNPNMDKVSNIMGAKVTLEELKVFIPNYKRPVIAPKIEMVGDLG